MEESSVRPNIPNDVMVQSSSSGDSMSIVTGGPNFSGKCVYLKSKNAVALCGCVLPCCKELTGIDDLIQIKCEGFLKKLLVLCVNVCFRW